MLPFDQINFSTLKGTPVKGWIVSPENPEAVVHILHGMMEHSSRYREFAGWMAEKGFAVYSEDHPGHGVSVVKEDDLGHLDDDKGWEEVLESVIRVQDKIREDHPGKPVFLMGHSFGSIVARSFAQRYADPYPMTGVVLSGAMQQPSLLLSLGLIITALQKARYGQRHRSRLMVTMGHGQYAKFFAPIQSRFDWLSSVPEVVEDYDDDPLCGYACTLGYYRNFFRILKETWKTREISRIPPDLPVLLLGGGLDPAIRFGKDTRNLKERYKTSGLKHVSMKIYKSGRHEMLNEKIRLEVYEYLRRWMEDQLAVSSRQ